MHTLHRSCGDNRPTRPRSLITLTHRCCCRLKRAVSACQTCPICLEEVTDSKLLCLSGCNHTFCKACVKQLVRYVATCHALQRMQSRLCCHMLSTHLTDVISCNTPPETPSIAVSHSCNVLCLCMLLLVRSLTRTPMLPVHSVFSRLAPGVPHSQWRDWHLSALVQLSDNPSFCNMESILPHACAVQPSAA